MVTEKKDSSFWGFSTLISKIHLVFPQIIGLLQKCCQEKFRHNGKILDLFISFQLRHPKGKSLVTAVIRIEGTSY